MIRCQRMGTNPCLCLQPLLLLIASVFHEYCCGTASQSHPSDTECQGICRGQGSGGLFLSHSATVGSAWKTHLKAHSLLSRVSTSSCDLPLPPSLVAPGFLCSPRCLSTQDGNSPAISGFDVLITAVLVGRMSEAGAHPPF